MKKMLSLLLALTMMLSLAACGGSMPNPENTVKEAMSAVNPFDAEKVNLYWGDGALNAEETDAATAQYVSMLFENMTYEITGSEVTDNTATVDVSITNTDMGTAMNDVMTTYFTEMLSAAFSGTEMSEDEMTNRLMELIGETIVSDEYETVTTDVELGLTYENKTWTITSGQDEAIDAMMGNITTYFENMETELENSLDGFTTELNPVTP